MDEPATAAAGCCPATAANWSSFRNLSISPEKAMPLRMHTTGVSVSIRRTMTPAK